MRVGVPCELNHGSHFDLTRPCVQAEVLRWLRDGRVWLVFLGTPCGRWSQARSTGRAGTDVDRAGYACARFTVRVLRLCRQRGIY
eukprot:5906207-Pyramimonas_sp.AAC.1